MKLWIVLAALGWLGWMGLAYSPPATAGPGVTVTPLTPWPLTPATGPTATEEPTLVAQTAIPATFMVATPTPTNNRPGSSYTATIEWDILAPSPPGPARTLLLPIDTPGLGPIEHADCAVWSSLAHTLTLYDQVTRPADRAGCSRAAKIIRRTGPDQGVYALTWKEGAGAFFEYLLYPGTVYPVTLLPDGGLRLQLP